MKTIFISKKAIFTDSKSTSLYLKDIGKIKQDYTKNLTIDSFERIEDYQNYLVLGNLKFAAQVAIRYTGMGLNSEDLISIANIGLIKASKLYDPTQNVKFISFAVWHIRAELTQAMNELSRTVRIPAHKIENSEYKSFSIDQKLNEDKDETTYGDKYLRADQKKSSLEHEGFLYEIKKALHSLPPKAQQALKMFYAIGYEFERSMEDIASELGVTAERVRQMIRRAEKQLKNSNLRFQI